MSDYFLINNNLFLMKLSHLANALLKVYFLCEGSKNAIAFLLKKATHQQLSPLFGHGIINLIIF